MWSGVMDGVLYGTAGNWVTVKDVASKQELDQSTVMHNFTSQALKLIIMYLVFVRIHARWPSQRT